MRFLFRVGGILLLVVVATVLLNTLRLPNHQFPPGPPAPVPALNADSITAHLAGALRIPTISRTRYADTDTGAFERFGDYLRCTFPLVQQRLSLQIVNHYGRLYKWPGSNPALKPLLLLAHQDVVPVLPGTEAHWTQPPFAGQIAGGYLYGRGALDDKLNVLGQLEAVEYLLRTGYRLCDATEATAHGTRLVARAIAGHAPRARARQLAVRSAKSA